MRIFKNILLLSLLTFSSTILAGPKEDLLASWEKFAALKSWKATMTDQKKGVVLSRIDYQAPDRWRVSSAMNPTMTVVSGTAYMKVEGKVMKIPIGKSIDDFKTHETIKKNAASMKIQSVVNTTLNGQPAIQYSYTTSSPIQASNVAWVSKKTGQIMRMQTTANNTLSVYDYSNFNDPNINIKAP